MKNLAYIVAGYIAIMMALSQTEIPYLEIPLLLGFNIGGMLAFTAAGKHRHAQQSSWILAGAILIRAYTYFHIYKVFTDDRFWTMIACNTVILVFELAIYFSHTGERQENEEIVYWKLKAQEWEKYALHSDKKHEIAQKEIEEYKKMCIEKRSCNRAMQSERKCIPRKK